MDCSEFIRDIESYLDGELSAERRAQLEAHIAECPQCELHFMSERLLKVALHNKLIKYLPQSHLADEVRDAIHEIG